MDKELPQFAAASAYVNTSCTGAQSVADYQDLFNNLSKSVHPITLDKIKKETPMPQDVSIRLVRIFIIDTDKNIPLEKRVLHTDERLTDLTDQELFFEYHVKEILSRHNEYRIKLVNKAKSEKQDKEVLLEEIRIKDLKMIVVEIFSA